MHTPCAQVTVATQNPLAYASRSSRHRDQMIEGHSTRAGWLPPLKPPGHDAEGLPVHDVAQARANDLPLDLDPI